MKNHDLNVVVEWSWESFYLYYRERSIDSSRLERKRVLKYDADDDDDKEYILSSVCFSSRSNCTFYSVTLLLLLLLLMDI